MRQSCQAQRKKRTKCPQLFLVSKEFGSHSDYSLPVTREATTLNPIDTECRFRDRTIPSYLLSHQKSLTEDSGGNRSPLLHTCTFYSLAVAHLLCGFQVPSLGSGKAVRKPPPGTRLLCSRASDGPGIRTSGKGDPAQLPSPTDSAQNHPRPRPRERPGWWHLRRVARPGSSRHLPIFGKNSEVQMSRSGGDIPIS